MDKKAKVATVTALVLAIAVIALVVFAPPAQCRDNIDNDNDGLTDYPNDLGCSASGDNSETDASLVCDNGVDESNDADSLKDYMLSNGDPGCTSASDASEVDGQCDDLSDNDGDGKSDYYQGATFPDSKCASFSDNDESPKDSCSNPDNNQISVQGTVSGDDNDVPFGYTDYCLNSTVLVEYTCGGVFQDYDPSSFNVDCSNMTGCLNGACA